MNNKEYIDLIKKYNFIRVNESEFHLEDDVNIHVKRFDPENSEFEEQWIPKLQEVCKFKLKFYYNNTLIMELNCLEFVKSPFGITTYPKLESENKSITFYDGDLKLISNITKSKFEDIIQYIKSINVDIGVHIKDGYSF